MTEFVLHLLAIDHASLPPNCNQAHKHNIARFNRAFAVVLHQQLAIKQNASAVACIERERRAIAQLHSAKHTRVAIFIESHQHWLATCCGLLLNANRELDQRLFLLLEQIKNLFLF